MVYNSDTSANIEVSMFKLICKFQGISCQCQMQVSLCKQVGWCWEQGQGHW